MPLRRPLVAVGVVVLLTAAEPLQRKHTNVERLAPERLAAVRADIERLHAKRLAVPPRPELTDYKCILHAHAEDSTHTGGTLPELLADAKKAGVNAILLTDHYRPPADFIDGRWRGLKDGVLFVPGSEARGFLLYPTKSILNRMELKGADFIDTVTGDNGMIFLSHVEERKDHPLDGLTGLEITNRHYDAKRDPASVVALALMLTDPRQLAVLEKSLRQFPDEVLAFQCDYPTVYLDTWDEGTKRRRLTGVAANDCHHNQIFLVKMLDADTVLVGTNASTHVLAPRLDESAIRAALQAGHAYVSHDWMGDPTGFRFETAGPMRAEMGDEVRLAAGLKLTARLPQPACVRLLRHGREVAKVEDTTTFEHAPKEPGAYRLEAWLRLDDDWRPWLYSNPIYVR